MRLFYFILSYFIFLQSYAQTTNRGGGGTDTRTTVKGNKRALIIGISDYEHNPLDLNYADDDAQLFKDYLLNVDKLKEENIIFLENSDAHAQAIYQGIDEIITVSKPGDEVYIYFAGHGDVVNREEEKIGFLLAHDVNGGRNYRGTDGVIALASLNKFINTLTSNSIKVILVLDACHSGFIHEEGAKTNMLTLSDGNNFMNTTKLLSCAPTQTSQEDASIGHGFFTYYLVMGMMGAADVGAQDNQLKYNELDDFVYEAVAAETQEQQEPFMISGIRRKVFKKLSSKHKAIALMAQEKSIYLRDTLRYVRTASGSTNKVVNALKGDQKEFNEALKKGLLIGSNNSAFAILKNIEAQGSADPVALSRMRFALSRKLTSPANRLINLYISGPKDLPLGNEFLQESKNVRQALELLDSDHPTRKALEVSALFLEAYSYIRNEDFGNYKIAQNLLKEALQKEPRAAYVLNALGILANENNDYKTAEEYYKSAIELIPTWSYPTNNLGSNYFNQYDYVRAKQYYENAIAINPDSQTPLINIAAIADNIGKNKEALEINKRHIQENVKSYTVYTNAAGILSENENIKQAQELYEQALVKFPKSPLALTRYSTFILNNEITHLDPELYLKKALEIQPDFATAISEYADYLRIRKPSQEAKEEAEKLYRKAIYINPHYMSSYAGLGYLLHSQKKEGASAAFELAIKNNPGKVEALYNYGRFTQFQLKDIEGAITLYKNVLVKNPYYKHAYQKLADIYLSQDKPNEANTLIQKYITIAGENPENLKLMGDLFYKQNDKITAASYYEKSIAIDPSFTKGAASLAYTYLDLNQYTKAVTHYNQAHVENPYAYDINTFQSTLYRKVRLLKRDNDLTKALELLEASYRLETNEESAYKYAFELYLFGEASQAIKILETVTPNKASWLKKYKILQIKLFIDTNELSKATDIHTEYINENASTDKALKLLLLAAQDKIPEAQKLREEINKVFITESRLLKNYSKDAIALIKKI